MEMWLLAFNFWNSNIRKQPGLQHDTTCLTFFPTTAALAREALASGSWSCPKALRNHGVEQEHEAIWTMPFEDASRLSLHSRIEMQQNAKFACSTWQNNSKQYYHCKYKSVCQVSAFYLFGWFMSKCASAIASAAFRAPHRTTTTQSQQGSSAARRGKNALELRVHSTHEYDKASAASDKKVPNLSVPPLWLQQQPWPPLPLLRYSPWLPQHWEISEKCKASMVREVTKWLHEHSTKFSGYWMGLNSTRTTRKTHLSNIDVPTETVHMVSSPALGHSIFSWLYTNIVYLQPWLHSANRETCSSGILHDFATMNLLPNCADSSLESWRSLKYFSAGTCWVLNLQPCTSSSPRWGLCCLDSSVSRWLDRF